MPQTGKLKDPVTTTHRLLPGDRAPALRLSRVFSRAHSAGRVTFDRMSVVVLWNAGCAGCLPTVTEIAEIAASHDAVCYGVAVMVRDVERTAAAANAVCGRTAVLALEERPAGASGLARGGVTRCWLEASGQQGLPAAFLIDAQGVVAWIGDPTEIRDVLPAVANGTWDVQVAREQWRTVVRDDEIAALRIVRDTTDALVAGQADAARQIIATGERQTPALANNTEFSIVKFQALAAVPPHVDAAVEHYARVTSRYPDDLRLQSSLAAAVIRQLGENDGALRIAADRLSNIGDRTAGSANATPTLLWCRLLQAEVLIRLGLPAEATIERAVALSRDKELAESARTWAASEIERLRGLLRRTTG